MVKRFECPRCGSGVRPNDTQCFRCGELLVEAAAPLAAPAKLEAKVTMERTATDRIPARSEPAKATGSHARKQDGAIKHLSSESATEEKNHLLKEKEKELVVREQAVEHSLEQLESDTRSLEEALKRYEVEEATVQGREKLLREREEALEAMAKRMEQVVAQAEAKEDASNQVAEEAQKLRQMSEEYSRHIAEDRARQKKLLDQEIEERMERLRTLQQMINIASNIKVEPPKEGDAEVIIRKMEDPGYDPEVVSKALDQLDREVRLASDKEDKLEFEVISTHDERLDHILGGGIPAGHVVIVNGSPGSMKSTLCYYMMHNAVRFSGKKGMYLSLEQKRDSIIRQMERMGTSHAQVEDSMMVVDMVDLRNAMKGEKGDWRQILMRYVKNVHAEMPFDIFVLDSLESFKGIAQFDFSRQHMMDLFEWFKSLNITVMVIAERPLDAMDVSKQGETYLADGVIELQLKEFDDAKVYRWMRCVKMRGMQIDPRFYAFYHTGQEFKFSLPLVTSSN
ncbi:MAG: AAA family ATPase [Methanomassiliicoccales archaeon]|nr:AAA family ATPase [Methanomassiliicoccales archaeon]